MRAPSAMVDDHQSRLEHYAIRVQGAYLRYDHDSQVLNGINMSVPEGAIYGLIGPSGCGKTTLINAILGIKKLCAGRIYVEYPFEKIGYMPQETALHNELSIGESLNYYGHIFNMSTMDISFRTKELLTFLGLPNKDIIVSKMSGGEKRRVSLCITLLHDPQLLVLDEPTVGIDPILSNSIWEKLLQLSKFEKKTILLTTHYLEEAKNSNKIGLMREGVMLTEKIPSALMTEQNCDTIEQAFLILIKRQNIINERQVIPQHSSEIEQSSYTMRNRRGIRGHRIWAILLKNVCCMKRNYLAILFMILLPAMQCLLMNLTVGREPEHLMVAVVNDELLNWENDCGNVTDSGRYSQNNQKLSCHYLEQLRQNKIDPVQYYDFDEAISAVDKNSVWGVLHFSENFTISLIERIEMTILAPSNVVQHSQLEIWLDMSNSVIGNSLKAHLSESFATFLKNSFKDCKYFTGGPRLPIQFNPLYGSSYPNMVHYTTPAVVVLSEFYFPIMFCIGEVLKDKLDGMLSRTLVVGVKIDEILIVHVLIQYVLLIIQTVLMMIIRFCLFDSPMIGSLLLCSGLLFLVGSAGISFGLLVAMYCNSYTSASSVGLSIYFILFSLSGMIWPLEGMHSALRMLSHILPVTLSIESFRGIAVKALTLDHPTVYAGFVSSFAWLVLLTTIICVSVKSSRNLWLA